MRGLNGKSLSAGWVWGLSAALVLCVFFSQKARLFYPLTDNEGSMACAALQSSFGLHLYRDIWHVRPPLVFVPFIILQKYFILDELTLHLFTTAIHVLDAFLIYALARRWGWRPRGAWASAFAYVFLIVPPLFLPWSAESDLLTQPWLLLAAWAAFSRQKTLWFLCGVLAALAFMTKQSAVFFVPAGLLALGIKNRTGILCAVAGSVAAGLLVCLPFIFDGRGALAAAEVLGTNGSYAQRGWNYVAHHLWYQNYLAHWGIWVLGTYGLFLIVFFRNAWGKVEGDFDPRLFLMVWFFGALASACASGYFFSYYFISLLAPLALGFGHWIERGGPKLGVVRIVLAGAFLLELAAFSLNVFQVRDRLFLTTQYGIARYCDAKAVGLAVRTLAKPGDKLLNWTFDPQITFYAGVPMALVRVTFINELSFLPQDAALLESRFRQKPPRFCVITRSPEVYAPPDWLKRKMGRDYRKVKTIGEFDLYARR